REQIHRALVKRLLELALLTRLQLRRRSASRQSSTRRGWKPADLVFRVNQRGLSRAPEIRHEAFLDLLEGVGDSREIALAELLFSPRRASDDARHHFFQKVHALVVDGEARLR